MNVQLIYLDGVNKILTLKLMQVYPIDHQSQKKDVNTILTLSSDVCFFNLLNPINLKNKREKYKAMSVIALRVDAAWQRVAQTQIILHQFSNFY